MATTSSPNITIASPERLRCGFLFRASDGLRHICDNLPGHDTRHYCKVHDVPEAER